MKTLHVFVLTLASLAAQSVRAHAELEASVPADEAAIAAAPKDVELRFSEPVRLTALTIQKADAPRQDLGPLPSGESEKFAVALPAALGNGSYVVTWRALSEDTHVMSGEFMFAVGTPAGAGTDAADASPPAAQPRDTHDVAH